MGQSTPVSASGEETGIAPGAAGVSLRLSIETLKLRRAPGCRQTVEHAVLRCRSTDRPLRGSGPACGSPGLAREDEDRRRVFGSALEQFDQLLVAAEAVGPATAPIPLFYAFSQGGRAFAAARVTGEEWRPRTHGLSVGDPGTSIGDTVLTPSRGRLGGSSALASIRQWRHARCHPAVDNTDDRSLVHRVWVVKHRHLDRPRTDAVHPYTAVGELDRSGLCSAHYRRLGRRVSAVAGRMRMRPVMRCRRSPRPSAWREQLASSPRGRHRDSRGGCDRAGCD